MLELTCSLFYSREAARSVSFAGEGAEYKGLALAVILGRRLVQRGPDTWLVPHMAIWQQVHSLHGKGTLKRQSLSQNLPLSGFLKQF